MVDREGPGEGEGHEEEDLLRGGPREEVPGVAATCPVHSQRRDNASKLGESNRGTGRGCFDQRAVSGVSTMVRLPTPAKHSPDVPVFVFFNRVLPSHFFPRRQAKEPHPFDWPFGACLSRPSGLAVRTANQSGVASPASRESPEMGRICSRRRGLKKPISGLCPNFQMSGSKIVPRT